MKQSGRNAYLLDEIRAEQNFGDIIGGSSGLRKVMQQVQLVAATDATVLITGKAGKELVARAIHGAIKTGRCNCGGVRLTFAGLWRRKSQCDSL